jgi:DnaA family protein
MKQLPLDIGLARPASLATFLAGPNEAAWKHLQLWAGSPTRSPVPTYLWGAPGSGKTHLLKAVQERLREQGAGVGWLDPSLAEPPGFDERWAVVLMDDDHLYSAVQQHAAFSWFVQAQALQRGVLAAGLLPPADLKLREDLRTRLGWGPSFALEPLREAEMRAVLRREADRRGLLLGDDVLGYLLTRFERNLKGLMALLERLDEFALASKRALTLPLLKAMLADEKIDSDPTL